MSNTHLEQARRAVSRASAPSAGGKNFELVLHLLDGASGTLDPAFDAQVQPLYMWALAHWQRWQTEASLRETSEHAQRSVFSEDIIIWNRVHGPATAVIPSASRIGWTIRGGRCLITDEGATLDLLLDPPVLIAQIARQAVRRWKLQNIARIFP